MQSEQWYNQSSVCGGVQGNKGEGGWNFPSRTETSPTSPEEFLSFSLHADSAKGRKQQLEKKK